MEFSSRNLKLEEDVTLSNIMNSRKDMHSKEVDLNFMNIENSSNFDKPLIVIAYLLCFLANLKTCFNKERINLGK